MGLPAPKAAGNALPKASEAAELQGVPKAKTTAGPRPKAVPKAAGEALPKASEAAELLCEPEAKAKAGPKPKAGPKAKGKALAKASVASMEAAGTDADSDEGPPVPKAKAAPKAKGKAEPKAKAVELHTPEESKRLYKNARDAFTGSNGEWLGSSIRDDLISHMPDSERKRRRF